MVKPTLTLILCSIQPPGAFHHVVTLAKSIAMGGHFLMYDTMHLTEWTRRWIHEARGAGTNTYHGSTVRILANMVIAWAVRGTKQGVYQHK